MTRSLMGWLLLVLGVAGCAAFRGRPVLPEERSLVLDQLVIHSDFDLPRQHRLLEELTALRGAVGTKLALPTSDEPIHVYLFGKSESFKEFARARFPDYADRRAFFVESDTRLSVYAHWGDRVAEDLRHEVSHGYLHAVVPDLPLWLDEGLAEYFEVPRGHRGYNRQHAEALSAAIGLGWRPDLARLERLPSAALMTQKDYAESWAWIHWLLETTPERQAVLRAHLQVLRSATEEVEPFSFRLRQLHLDYERQLLDHIARFASAGN